MDNITVYITKDTQRKASSKASCYVTSSMRKDLINEVGFDGYALFEHLLNRKESKHKLMDDTTLANELGFTNSRALAKTRKKLENAHWYLSRKTKNIQEYFIGKKSVLAALFGDIQLPFSVKLKCKELVKTKLGIVSEVEDASAFLSEFEYYKTKAEEFIRENNTEKEVIAYLEAMQ